MPSRFGELLDASCLGCSQVLSREESAGTGVSPATVVGWHSLEHTPEHTLEPRICSGLPAE